MRKAFRKIFALTLVLTMINVSAVFAAAPGFTGWTVEASAPAYFLNGVQVKSSWVKQGNTYYYLNESGNVVPNFIVNQDGVRASGITTYIDTNNGGKTESVVPLVPDTYKPVRDIYGVTDDYEAFVKRFSGYAEVYGMTDTTYQAYLASYNGQTPGTKYLDSYLTYLNDAYTAHRYNHHYENMFNGTHKAYCECGAWEYQNCHRTIALGNGGPYQCPYCESLSD